MKLRYVTVKVTMGAVVERCSNVYRSLDIVTVGAMTTDLAALQGVVK